MPSLFKSTRTKGVEPDTDTDTVVINMYVPRVFGKNIEKRDTTFVCYSIKCEFKLDENNSEILDFLLNKSEGYRRKQNLQYYDGKSHYTLLTSLGGRIDIGDTFSSSAKAPTQSYQTQLGWYNCLRSYEGNDLIQAAHGIYFYASNKRDTEELTFDWDRNEINAQLEFPVSHQAINQLTNVGEQGGEGNVDEPGGEENAGEEVLTVAVYVRLKIPEGIIELYYINDSEVPITIGNIEGVTFYGKNSAESAYEQISALTKCELCVIDTCSLGNGGNESSGGGAYKKKNRRSRARKSSKKRKVRKSSRRRSSKRNTRRYRKSRKQNRKH